MISRDVTIVNQLGMHARAAAKFVHLASSYQSRIVVSRSGQSMDGRSIIGLLLLAAARGSVVTIMAEGPDEQLAADALVALVASGFGEGAWTG
jgi:phosphocarrier protein